MATVHLGRLVGLGGFSKVVAIKRMHRKLASTPALVELFLHEARVAAHVEHANVVSTLDIVSEDGELIIVMEYVAGESVAHLAARARARDEPIPPPIAA